MAEYYYFASSLPMLRIDREPLMDYKTFMEKAKEQLSEKDYKDLELAVLQPKEGDAKLGIVSRWQDFIKDANAAINKARAQKLGFEGYDLNLSKELEAKAEEIVYEKDPLEGERAILSLFFDFLSSNEGSTPFSSESLMIYALKLQLIERYYSFSEEKGRSAFDSLYRDVESRLKG